jgi:predicted oxidoreductase
MPSNFLEPESGRLLYPRVPGLSSSRLVLGCMNFGGTWAPGDTVSREAMEVARAAFLTALDLGWDFFDHADIYGRGRSEAVFGQLMEEVRVPRESILIQTKCGIRFADDPVVGAPHRYDFSPVHIRRSLEESLRRLRTDYVDVLLLHRPDLLAEPEEVVEVLEALRSEGKARAFGVSNFPPFLLDLYAGSGLIPVAHQVEISLLKPALVEAPLVAQSGQPALGHPGDGSLEWHRRHGVVTQAWAPLAYGYLCGRTKEGAEERIVEGTRLVKRLAEEKAVSAEAIVIAWLLKHPACIQPIIGTTDPGRLRGCAEALTVELSREEWYGLHRTVRGQALA